MDTSDASYTQRLTNLQEVGWKKHLAFLNPYRWHIRRVISGPTLEVGCGIGRVLEFAPDQIVGTDHNVSSVAFCRQKGFTAYTFDYFTKRYQMQRPFTTLLMSHLLEHMTRTEAVDLIKAYRPYLKDGAKIVAITPQEVGQASDKTHVEFMDFSAVRQIFAESGIKVERHYSFPFPRFMGKVYIYNEFVSIGYLAET